MKIVTLLLLWFSTRRSVIFANEALDAVTDVLGVILANESADKNGAWVQLAPYGRFDNAQGVQEFSREDATTIVNEFESLKNTPQRLLGLPWYIGHPDHPRFKDKYKDTRAYGRIKALEARDDGLFANVKWSPAGKQLVEDEAFHGHSVNWRVKKVGSVFHPVSLKSVGFTNEPQIPVAPAMANETQPNNTMPKWLIDLLVAAGLMKADGTEENAQSAVKSLIENAGKLPALENEKKAAAEMMANEKKLRETAEARVASLETQFANERKARRDVLLNQAQSDGRIVAADRSKWEGDFANEFDGTAKRLAETKPSLKMQRTTPAYLANRGAAPSKSKVEQVQEFVNERMASSKEDYHTAFNWVQANKPELFQGMKQPAKSE